ncbi:MAG: NADH-quinone oxidoreductase subunit C, partial [Archaeoglobaceae archaeon]|nr:NADH-quinone oxidoreductase subunit C [Archaeoglobaceae archaeon]
FGNKLVGELKENLGNLAERITITGKNRICIKVNPENLQKVAAKLKDKFDHVKSVNVIDVTYDNSFIVEYVISSYSDKELMPVLVTIATKVSKSNPKLPSLHKYWISADYLEREMQDLFGVIFEGNPWGSRRFLIDPSTPEYPLRKDFKLEEEVYVRGDQE